MNLAQMFILLLACLFLSCFETKSQSLGVVRDSTTNEPIPYVNMWIDGELIGTTSDEKGNFIFNADVIGKRVILSSIGYKKKSIVFTKNAQTILLKPEILHLKEVVIKSSKEKTRFILEKLKASDIRLFFFCDGMPYMKARFFPYKEEYAKTPYLSKVDIVTNSTIENATFNLRLYTLDQFGNPGKSIYADNIIVAVKKGRNITSINLTDKQIEFPVSGLLLAFEYLIVKQNEFTIRYTIPPDTVKVTKVVYAPSVGVVPAETNEDSWIYKNGNWQRDDKNKNIKQKMYADKFDKLAIRVLLTN